MGYLSKQMRRILPVGVAHDHGHGARRNFAVARDGADVSDPGRQRGQNAVFVDAKRRRSVFGAAEKLDAAARKRVGIDRAAVRAAPLDGKKNRVADAKLDRLRRLNQLRNGGFGKTAA